jgi:hypothetical protein
MDFRTAMDLAEIRHAELLAHAARHRQTRRAERRHSGRRRWSRVLRDAVLVVCAGGSSIRRPNLTKPANLAPAAETA